MRVRSMLFPIAAFAIVVACGSEGGESDFVEPPSGDLLGAETGTGFGDQGDASTPPPGGCKNLQCKQVTCQNGGKTTVSGIVVAPTPPQYGAADPIYNAIVYVPNGTPQAFTEGVTCDKCGVVASGEPLVTALTGADGKFVIENVPVGDDIPLVVQIGRWRRQVKIPKVAACADTALDKELTRLPRNKAEGDIPLFAIATSVYDPTECILRKIGIADAEFTVPSGNGRVHIYKGSGATVTGAPAMTTLWADIATLKKYDLVAFPCQTSGYPDANGKARIVQYADAGGRVYVTDLAQDVIKNGAAPWPTTANFNGPQTGAGSMAGKIDMTFPKGQALADWLQIIKATTVKGDVTLQNTYERLTTSNAVSQRWVYAAAGAGNTQTYSFNTPVGADAANQCGRAVYSSFHIAAGGGAGTFPAGCTAAPLTAQEKMLEFFLFDLAACIQKDDTAPVPPPPIVK